MQVKLNTQGGWLFLSIFFLFILVPVAVFAKGDILINEIFPNPEGSDSGKEFVELYNKSDEDILLSDWLLKRTSEKGIVKIYHFKNDDEIESKKYLEVKFSSLNNDGATIELIDGDGKILDNVEYINSLEGQSYNRDEKDEENQWYWAESTGGGKNVENPANKKYLNILINEILPNPKEDEENNEFIELYNPNKKDVDLKNWRLRDGSKTGKYIFKKSTKIKAGDYLVIYRRDFKFALNNSGGEVVKLVAPNQKIKSEIKYQSAKEGISYNFDLSRNNWRWSKFLTPGGINRFNHLPTFKLDKPKKVYKNIYAEFELHKLKDVDGDGLKITWDFGDGHKSYLKKTKHKYEKTGKYLVRLIVRDDSEDVVKEFKIKVKKYPKYKLKIVGILPNPNGKDKGKEIILIKNLDKRRISLKNYKIGTGKNKDKILGHPFYKEVKIKSGEIKKIINDDSCKFSLSNKNGVVQILYPNGKIADEVIYGKDKIFPEEMYKLDENSGQWYWRGGAGVKSKILREKLSDVQKNANVDITLDDDKKICKTKEQIKKDNWMDRWINKWLF